MENGASTLHEEWDSIRGALGLSTLAFSVCAWPLIAQVFVGWFQCGDVKMLHLMLTFCMHGNVTIVIHLAYGAVLTPKVGPIWASTPFGDRQKMCTQIQPMSWLACIHFDIMSPYLVSISTEIMFLQHFLCCSIRCYLPISWVWLWCDACDLSNKNRVHGENADQVLCISELHNDHCVTCFCSSSFDAWHASKLVCQSSIRISRIPSSPIREVPTWLCILMIMECFKKPMQHGFTHWTHHTSWWWVTLKKVWPSTCRPLKGKMLHNELYVYPIGMSKSLEPHFPPPHRRGETILSLAVSCMHSVSGVIYAHAVDVIVHHGACPLFTSKTLMALA